MAAPHHRPQTSSTVARLGLQVSRQSDAVAVGILGSVEWALFGSLLRWGLCSPLGMDVAVDDYESAHCDGCCMTVDTLDHRHNSDGPLVGCSTHCRPIVSMHCLTGFGMIRF